ncbi:hypothetical protein CR203_17525 [Salipaludibacillus neizhouensis]|uniref:Diguanylate cyclase n=1 Tax=Salipaludibacillus neizhouensis TaxID=885475 RepID=A0A3A9K6Y6_9BACI|nr:sensor domain-containing diguanylate cyclase [Salipaludibacillus neizhouensis]RKL66091.1 hypothetical protein CR203_17525 [Salipaludibacillus neizhouensis]
MNEKVDRSILFEQVFQFSSMGIALISNEGYFLLTNPMLTEMLGYSETELKEKTFIDLTYVEDLHNSIDRFRQLVNDEVSYYQVEKRYIHKNSMLINCLLNVSAVRDDAGKPLYFISQFQDISDQKLYEHQLKESEEQLTEILETMPNGVLMFDLQGNISYANKMAEEILEINRAEIVSRKMDTPEWKLRTVEGKAIPREELPFSIVMKTKEPVKDFVHAIESGSGTRKVLSINNSPLFDHTGTMTAVLCSLVNITEKKQTEYELIEANKLLKKLSEHDGLTGVANRRYFDEQLKNYWVEYSNRNIPVSLIMLDLDYFKLYNDEYGHQAGDDCLKTITKIIGKELVGLDAVFARYGGEEFSVILPGYSHDMASDLTKKIHGKMQQLKIVHAKSPVCSHVTLSFGFSTINPDSSNSPSDLIKQADLAMYSAKQNGRNTIAYHDIITVEGKFSTLN